MAKNIDVQYLELVDKILKEGVLKENRTGIDTKAIAGAMIEHDMSEGFPLLTTKKMYFKGVKVELEGFIKGITSKQWFKDKGCNIWNEWANPMKAPYGHDDASKARMLEEDDLGKIYGYQWVNFGSQNKQIISFPPKVTKFQTTDKIELPHGKDQNEWYYFPKVCGVACLGKPIESSNKKLEDILYKNWYDMVNRCVNPESTQFAFYGRAGVKICDRWLCFENYRADVIQLPRWQDKLRDPSGFVLDKDYYGAKVYAPDTCVYLSTEENIMYNNSSLYLVSSVEQEVHCLTKREVAEILGFSRKNVDTYLDKNKEYEGWRIREIKDGNVHRYQLPVNQLRRIVTTLKKNPNDRRMICSAWNASELEEMALVPCHTHWQVTVINGKLNLAWYQRSVDVPLGLPFNIASYGLLLHLLAKEAGLKEGRLIGFLMDTHIYVNQVDALQEQICREPMKLPTIATYTKEVDGRLFSDEIFDVFKWEHNHTLLNAYVSHPPVKFDIAV